MVELLKAYETDLSKHVSSANKKLASISGGKSSDSAISDILKDIKDAEHWLKQMENQLFQLPQSLAGQYQKKIQRYQETIKNLKKSLEDEQNKKGKVELFGKAQNDQREKLLTNNEILQSSGDVLEDALKVGIETEQIANDTMHNLKKQRGQIQNINEKVNDVGNNVTKANRTIGVMDRRRICIKLVMMATIVLLVIAFAICLYIKVG
jgi:vacuolar-type H+-ATPase subunit I/STV1